MRARKQDEFTLAETRKLWKGLFYGMWSADRLEVQEQLAERLASVIVSLESTSAALVYIESFWSIIVLEWSGIDRLRLNKFYLLIRRFVHYSLLWLGSREWDEVLVVSYGEIVQKLPLCAEARVVPDGIKLFYCDIFVETLSSLDLVGRQFSPRTTLGLLEPFIKLYSCYPVQSVAKRINEKVLGKINSMSCFSGPALRQAFFEYGSKRYFKRRTWV